jgi:hypothetical protein
MICDVLRRTDPEGSRMNNNCVVELRKAERKRLLKLLSAGIAPARMLTRARILLKADVGEHAGECPALVDREIAGMLQISAATVGQNPNSYHSLHSAREP